MFAYCRNNPICRTDMYGMADKDCFDQVDDDLDVTPGEDDLGYSSGNCSMESWSTFKTTMKAAASGLNMAMGEKNGVEDHHFFSNKNKKYTPKFNDVANITGWI